MANMRNVKKRWRRTDQDFFVVITSVVGIDVGTVVISDVFFV